MTLKLSTYLATLMDNIFLLNKSAINSFVRIYSVDCAKY